MNQQTTQLPGAQRPLDTASFFGPNLHPAVSRLVGGRRGMVDGALPPAIFVAVSALGGMVVSRPWAIGFALALAAGTAVSLGIWRLRQDQTLKQVVRGLVALTVAVIFVVLTGEPRAFFLPGLYVDAAYAVLFASSVLVGRPLAGVVYAALFQTGPGWRQIAKVRRAFVVATLGWSAIYALRAGAQWFLYQADAPVLMAVAKVSLGWPVTIVAVALTLAAVRRAVRGSTGTSDVS